MKGSTAMVEGGPETVRRFGLWIAATLRRLRLPKRSAQHARDSMATEGTDAVDQLLIEYAIVSRRSTWRR
jgi:hypothetical protein